MTKLLVLTDLHILRPGERIIGLDPSARFVDAVTHALHHHGEADHMILTGDLTHHGRVEEYEQLATLLADVPMPITFLLGNHDDRAIFKTVFPEVPCDANGFVQTVIDTASHRLICLDTVHPETSPRHAGHLCPTRLSWLQRTLVEADRPSIVFQHHPPMNVGFSGMDRIKLDNGDEELALLAEHRVAHLVAGHIHRTISGTSRGVSYSIFKSPCHQMPMMLGPSSSSSSVDEPGAYGIVLLAQDDIVVHSEDVGLASWHEEDPASAS